MVAGVDSVTDVKNKIGIVNLLNSVMASFVEIEIHAIPCDIIYSVNLSPESGKLQPL